MSNFRTCPFQVPGPIPLITIEEVVRANEKMKNEKASSPDDIPFEVRKAMGQGGAILLEKRVQ